MKVNFVKRVKPGTWVILAFVSFFALIGTLMTVNYISSLPVQREATLALYNNKDANRKVKERTEIALKLDLKDKSAEKYPIQLEGRAGGSSWQVVKTYTATKPNNTVVFRVRPAVVGDVVYRAEVQTPSGVVTSNELVLHVTN